MDMCVFIFSKLYMYVTEDEFLFSKLYMYECIQACKESIHVGPKQEKKNGKLEQ